MEDDDLVRRVHVKALPEREHDGAVVERRVGGRVVRRDRRVREPRHELLHVADPQRAAEREAEGRVVPGRSVGRGIYVNRRPTHQK